jgi:cytochrome oxidase Cu insertion factor (SCO1/SenC/PrrC family)
MNDGERTRAGASAPPAASGSTSGSALRLLIATTLLVVVFGGIVWVASRRQPQASAAGEIHVIDIAPALPQHQVPDFQLTERSGKPLALADLRGKVWIADFIFTRCRGPCPMMTAKMKAMHDVLADAPDARFVTITMDPKFDTPAVLSKYAEANGASERWLFVTGPEPAIEDLSIKGFKLGAGQDGGQIVHSSRFILVDRTGKIRGYYDSEEEGAERKLVADARALLKEATTP